MDNQKIITVKCDSKTTSNINDLIWFQDDLKTIEPEDLQALKKSIIENGILSPFFAWENEGKKYIMDGHHRIMALKLLLEDGYFIPELPVVLIFAATKKQAAEQLLVLNSVYAKITNDGISKYMIQNEIDLSFLQSVNIPNIDKSFIENVLEYKQQNIIKNNNNHEGEFNPSESIDEDEEHDRCPHCGEIL